MDSHVALNEMGMRMRDSIARTQENNSQCNDQQNRQSHVQVNTQQTSQTYMNNEEYELKMDEGIKIRTKLDREEEAARIGTMTTQQSQGSQTNLPGETPPNGKVTPMMFIKRKDGGANKRTTIKSPGISVKRKLEHGMSNPKMNTKGSNGINDYVDGIKKGEVSFRSSSVGHNDSIRDSKELSQQSNRLKQIFVGLQGMELARHKQINLDLKSQLSIKKSGDNSGRESQQQSQRYRPIQPNQLDSEVLKQQKIHNRLKKQMQIKSVPFNYNNQTISHESQNVTKFTKRRGQSVMNNNQNVNNNSAISNAINTQNNRSNTTSINNTTMDRKIWERSTYMSKNDMNKISRNQLLDPSHRSGSTKESNRVGTQISINFKNNLRHPSIIQDRFNFQPHLSGSIMQNLNAEQLKIQAAKRNRFNHTQLIQQNNRAQHKIQIESQARNDCSFYNSTIQDGAENDQDPLFQPSMIEHTKMPIFSNLNLFSNKDLSQVGGQLMVHKLNTIDVESKDRGTSAAIFFNPSQQTFNEVKEVHIVAAGSEYETSPPKQKPINTNVYGRLENVVEAKKNLKSSSHYIIEQQKEILKEPQTLETYQKRFTKENIENEGVPGGMTSIISQISNFINYEPLIDYSKIHDASSTCVPSKIQYQNDVKVQILKQGSRLRNTGHQKHLYDNTTAKLKMFRENGLPKADKAYNENTVFSTESKLIQMQGNSGQYKRSSTVQGTRYIQTTAKPHECLVGGVGSHKINWTCHHKITDLARINPKIVNTFNKSVQNGEEVCNRSFIDALREDKNPIKNGNADKCGCDDTISDSKRLLALKHRFRDKHIYGRNGIPANKSSNIQDWRSEMKCLEDHKNERNIYDRIGIKEKNLLEERQEATQETRMNVKKKFKIERDNYKLEFSDRTKLHQTLATNIRTQSCMKQGEVDMNVTKYEQLQRMDKNNKGKKKLKVWSWNNDIQLHPLQREQNLENLIEQQETNEIMNDFGIPLERQKEIKQDQREELTKQNQESIMEKIETSLKNSIIKKCLKDFDTKNLSFVPGLPAKANNSIVYPQTPKLNPVIPPEIAMQKVMDKSADFTKVIDECKIEQRLLDDDIRRHVEFVRIKGYEKMAEIKMQKSNETNAHPKSDESLSCKGDEIIQGKISTYKYLNDEEMEVQLFKDNIKEGISAKLKRAAEKGIAKSRFEKNEVWTGLLHTKAAVKDAPLPPEQLERAVVRKDFNDMVDSYYANGKLNCSGGINLANLGTNPEVVEELIKTKTVAQMSPVQVQEIIRHFTEYSMIFFSMKSMIKEYFNSNGTLTDKMEFSINNLILDESFLSKILSGNPKITDKIEYCRHMHGKDTFLYYIFEGTIMVLNAETKEYMTQYEKGQFFYVSRDIQQKKKFVFNPTIVDQLKTDRDSQMATTPKKSSIMGSYRSANESVVMDEIKPSFMKYILSDLAEIFVKQINIQYLGLRKELQCFGIINCLNTDELDFLATIGKSQTKVQDYLSNEVIVNEGFRNMDHFYLVIQGNVRMEKNVPLTKIEASVLTEQQQVDAAKKNMGTVEPKQHFCLKEMLFIEMNQKRKGKPNRFLASQHKYIAMHPQELTTKVIKINYYDFKKIMYKNDIKKMMMKFKEEYDNIIHTLLNPEKTFHRYEVSPKKAKGDQKELKNEPEFKITMPSQPGTTPGVKEINQQMKKVLTKAVHDEKNTSNWNKKFVQAIKIQNANDYGLDYQYDN